MPVLSYTYDRADGKYNILVLMVQYSKKELIKYDGYHIWWEKGLGTMLSREIIRQG